MACFIKAKLIITYVVILVDLLADNQFSSN